MKEITNYEGYYYISKNGEVFSTPKDGKPDKLLKQEIVKSTVTTYRRVTLSKDGVAKRFSVHRLVAQAYIPNPENKPNVNHIDNDGSNNHVDNLEWCTQAENIQHSVAQNRHLEKCKAAGRVIGDINIKKAKEKYDAMVGQTFGKRKLLSILEYKKHPKGWFLCTSCGKEFSGDISNTLLNRKNSSLSCRPCSVSEASKARNKIKIDIKI